MKKIWLFLGLFVVINVSADVRMSCQNDQGVNVATLNVNSFHDGAFATKNPQGEPIIIMNWTMLNQLPESMVAFVYAHECAHHALGHFKMKTALDQIENQADCWAINKLMEKSYLTGVRYDQIKKVVSKMDKKDKIHEKGELRIAKINQCVQQQSAMIGYQKIESQDARL